MGIRRIHTWRVKMVFVATNLEAYNIQ
jgi:hypothetical protein